MAITVYIFSIIHMAWTENTSIEQPRVFHLSFDYNFDNKSIDPDIQMDLEVRYPRGILIEGDRVDIFGEAIPITEMSQNIIDVAINFQNAQEYPVAQDGRGITKGVSLNMIRSPSSSKLTGNETMVWNIVGTYYPRLFITRLQDNGRPMIHYAETKDAAITIYPKSLLAQIITNKAMLLLAGASYCIALLGAFKIIYSILFKNH